MRRREFITLLGGAAVSWPVVARAQQGGPVKRVGFLTLASLKDGEGFLAAFRDGLRSHSLIEGKNLKLDYRYSEGDVKRLTPLAQELIALRPEVLVGGEPSSAKVLKSIATNIANCLSPALRCAAIRSGGKLRASQGARDGPCTM